jgi:hypothetical protein
MAAQGDMMKNILMAVTLALSACATTSSVDDEFPDSLWEPFAEKKIVDCAGLKDGALRECNLTNALAASEAKVRKLERGKAEEPKPRRAGIEALRPVVLSSGAEFRATVGEINAAEDAIEIRGLSQVAGSTALVCPVGITGDILPVEGGRAIYPDLDGDGQPDSALPYRCAPAHLERLAVAGVGRGKSVLLLYVSPTSQWVAVGGRRFPLYGNAERWEYLYTPLRSGVWSLNARDGGLYRGGGGL